MTTKPKGKKGKHTNNPKKNLSKKIGKFHRVKLTHDKRGALLTIYHGRNLRNLRDCSIDHYRADSDAETRQYYHGIKRVRDIDYLQSN